MATRDAAAVAKINTGMVAPGKSAGFHCSRREPARRHRKFSPDQQGRTCGVRKSTARACALAGRLAGSAREIDDAHTSRTSPPRATLKMNNVYPYTIDNGHGERLPHVQRTHPGAEWRSSGSRRRGAAGCRPADACPLPSGRGRARRPRTTRVSGALAASHSSPVRTNSLSGRRACPHKWWNAGSDELHMTGWCSPPHNVEFFLTTLFSSTKANGGRRPETLRRSLPGDTLPK